MEERLERLEVCMKQICSLLQEVAESVRKKHIKQDVITELRTERIRYLTELIKRPRVRRPGGRDELQDEIDELDKLKEEHYIAQQVKKRSEIIYMKPDEIDSKNFVELK